VEEIFGLIVELLLDLIAERPIGGLIAVTGCSFIICFILTDSIVPIILGVLIALGVGRGISQPGLMTLGLSEKPTARGLEIYSTLYV
jgi:hypothetical protein